MQKVKVGNLGSGGLALYNTNYKRSRRVISLCTRYLKNKKAFLVPYISLTNTLSESFPLAQCYAQFLCSVGV